jgi:N-acetylmuramoyl-L-alanine amidase
MHFSLLAISAFFVATALAASARASTASETAVAIKPRQKIVLDAGHGGLDTGASNGQAMESDIALRIAKLVSAQLTKSGYKIIMTRTKDEAVSLERRAAIANESEGDLFVSIHLNSSTDTRAQGKEFYFQNQLAVDEESLFLANRENHEHEDPMSPSVNPGQDRIQKAGLRNAEAARIPDLNIAKGPVRTDVRSILEDLDRTARIRESSELAKVLYQEWQGSEASKASRGSSRGIRQAPFFLVSNIAMPSVLVEVGFLSNAKEGAKLQRSDYQAALAEALASGIDRYLKRTEL